MTPSTSQQYRPIDLPKSPSKRARQTLLRGILRHCPYCGGGDIFKSWFTLKDRCPHCNTLFAHEDGYFLGSYVINLVLTSFVAMGIVLWMLLGSDLSVVQMQIAGVIIAVGFPLFFFPYSLSFWMTLDLVIHTDFSNRPWV